VDPLVIVLETVSIEDTEKTMALLGSVSADGIWFISSRRWDRGRGRGEGGEMSLTPTLSCPQSELIDLARGGRVRRLRLWLSWLQRREFNDLTAMQRILHHTATQESQLTRGRSRDGCRGGGGGKERASRWSL
jgi:hypothetical protein